jgi:FMN phosphatase YigB (HAD superfamily)
MTDHPNSKSIQAVLLDFGGVVYNTPHPFWLPAFLRLMRSFHRNLRQENAILLMMHVPALESQVVMDLMTGKTSEQAVWDDLQRKARLPLPWFQRIRRGAVAPKRLNTELLAYLSCLRSHMKTALLTNAGSEFRPTFVTEYRLDTYFDRVIISAEEKLAKPDPALYRKALDLLDVAPHQALFFDDRPENVEGAQAVGMQAHVYRNNQQVIRLIEQARQG